MTRPPVETRPLGIDTLDRRSVDRRSALRLAALAGMGSLAILASTPAGIRAVLARQGDAGLEVPANPYFNDALDVLNYALTLEHLDATLYRQGLEQFAAQAFVDVGYDASVRDYLQQIAVNEETQAAFLSETIAALGGEPVGPATYVFPYATVEEWLALSLQVEEIGLDAYTGAAQYLLGNDDLLTAALSIHAVEARHLSYVRLLNGVVPFPEAVEAPLTPEEVVALASPLVEGGLVVPSAAGIGGGAAGATPAAGA
jgi:bacterioferritin (cytochrome b1)